MLADAPDLKGGVENGSRCPGLRAAEEVPQLDRFAGYHHRMSLTRDASLAGKVHFLSTPEAYGTGSGSVEARETQMSWVFLTPDRVYKLKKPQMRLFLDFSTIRKRHYFCDEELRLNRRLAVETYLRVLPLRRGVDGRYTLGDHGRVADWLVEMKRLRQDDMLDRRIAQGCLATSEVAGLAHRLADFYRSLPPQFADGHLYLTHLIEEQKINRTILLRTEFSLGDLAGDLVARTDEALSGTLPEVEARARSGLIVEGHGDLRPEHVWLGDPLQIIDCLEFSRSMRMLDPYDEMNYLGMECDVLGADWIREQLLETLSSLFGRPPSPRLLAARGAFRALLRARLSIVHLLDTPIRNPEKWRPLTLRYLEQARRELAMSRSPAVRRLSRLRAAV